MALHRLYYKITAPDGDTTYFSGLDTHRSPQRTLAHVRKIKARQVPGYKYDLATKEEYEAFWAKVNQDLRAKKQAEIAKADQS